MRFIIQFIPYFFLKGMLERINKGSYDSGLSRGYKLGFVMGKVEERNQSYRQPKVICQVDEIVKGKGF